MNNSFSIKQVISESWQEVKKNPKFFVALALISWIIQFVPSYINGQITNTTVALLVSIISWLVNTAVTIGLITISVKYVQTKNATFNDGLAKMNRFLPYVLGSIYYSLIVLVGMLLLIVPGIIWAIKYQFYGYLIVDQGLGPKEALAKSKEITQGKGWHLFVFSLALFGVNLLGLLLLGVGLLITIPISLLAIAHAYKALMGASSTPAQASSTNPAPANVWKTYRQS